MLRVGVESRSRGQSNRQRYEGRAQALAGGFGIAIHWALRHGPDTNALYILSGVVTRSVQSIWTMSEPPVG